MRLLVEGFDLRGVLVVFGGRLEDDGLAVVEKGIDFLGM